MFLQLITFKSLHLLAESAGLQRLRGSKYWINGSFWTWYPLSQWWLYTYTEFAGKTAAFIILVGTSSITLFPSTTTRQ